MYPYIAIADTKRGVVTHDTGCIMRSMTTWRDRARRRLKELGLTQDDLMEPLDVSTRGAVGHYLSGRRKPSIEQAAALARALQMSLDELVFGRGPRRSDADAISSPEAQHVLERLRHIEQSGSSSPTLFDAIEKVLDLVETTELRSSKEKKGGKGYDDLMEQPTDDSTPKN